MRLLALLAFLAASCTTVVHPPPAVGDPVTVVLLSHGRSSSLVLPDDEGVTRWAFGDWTFYALGEKGVGDAIAALFWPSSAALGRQWIDGAGGEPAAYLDRVGIVLDEAFPIRVERDAVADLRGRLGTLFELHRESLVYGAGPRLEFVRIPERYWIVNSSNRKVAAWLRELGCRTSGITLRSKWRVEPAVATQAP